MISAHLGAPSSTNVSKSKSGPKLTKVSPKLGRGPTPERDNNAMASKTGTYWREGPLRITW
jgi:hypothetical protein